MFLRRSRGRDVQALAARRLAALAEGFDRVERVPDPPGHQHHEENLLGSAVDPGGNGLPPGRHADRSAKQRPWASAGWSRLTSQHLAVIAIAVAVACVVTGWQVLRSVPETQPLELSSTRITPTESSATVAGAPSPTPSGGAPAPSANATLLVIDVTGKVRRPGIIELPVGSRVVDALKAAGGARPLADTSRLNLARPLVDGEQIAVGIDVPSSGARESSASGESGPSIVSINLATAEQLEALPGVGPVTAAAIVEWRTRNGSFTSVDELLEVSGIGEVTLAEIRPFAQL
jgi:competence protein ComEA